MTIVAATEVRRRSRTWRALAEAGIEVVGENRAQDLAAKHARPRRRLPLALHRPPAEPQGDGRERALRALPLARSASPRRSGSTIPALVEVNLSGRGLEVGAPGGRAGGLPAPVRRTCVGLMTMPPFTDDPEDSRPYFRRLRELAERHGLRELSMGTSQDYRVAADEGRHDGAARDPFCRAGNIPDCMGFADVWNRTLVYFGIAEEDDEWDEDGYADRGGPRAHLQRAPERPHGSHRGGGSATSTTGPTRSPRRPSQRRPCCGRGTAAARPGRRVDRPLRRDPVGAGAPRRPAQLQRRAADRRQVQGRDPGDPQPPERRPGALEAPDRLRERPHLRARRRHAARRRQGLPAHAAQRRGLGRGARPPAGARASSTRPEAALVDAVKGRASFARASVLTEGSGLGRSRV